MSLDALFQPLTLGAVTLSHRVVMPPLTRMRASQPGRVPQSINATYYAQRASKGGLIIAEATDISPAAIGYPGAPGLYTEEQVAGWRLVTDAVHARGGIIFCQIWHTGRISHRALQPDGAQPVSASDVTPPGKHFTPKGMLPFEAPRPLELDEIPAIIAQFRQAAANARRAGFDGIELHSANGYLLDQFLQDGTNHRTDSYGGGIGNRARLLLEVADAVSAEIGADRVGVRLSPWGSFNGMSDSDPGALYDHVADALGARGLAYLHLVEPRADQTSDILDADAPDAASRFKARFGGPVIAAGGFTGGSAAQVVASGAADAVAFGRLFIANPDLPERLRIGAPLNRYDRTTFYGGTARGYLDYPEIEQDAAPEVVASAAGDGAR